jgi:CheY-like chemotaxis protein
MDHMMPGMDGFQAVKAIKANPATATIPVMMYTSKGGDLYLGQARALGAVGVLPKTVAPAELFESLRKIGLVGERRTESRRVDEDDASERAEDLRERRPPPPVAPFSEPGMRAHGDEIPAGQLDQLRDLLEGQRVELRKDILLSMETVARQTGAKLQREVEEQVDQLQAESRQPATRLTPVSVLTALLAVSLLTNLLIYRDRQHAAPAGTVTTLEHPAGEVPTPDATTPPALDATRLLLHDSWLTTAWALNRSLQYAYDEIALDGQRIELIETLLQKLRDSDFSGTLVLETHVGEFCLLGDQDSGFRLPAPELTVDQCDFIGNPVQAADTPAAQQSLRFANFVASTPLLADERITLEVRTLPRREELEPYPEKSAATSAYAWNRAAQANNRVSVDLMPREIPPSTP